MSVSYTNLVEGILNQVDSILHNYVFNGYQALASYLEVPLGLAIVLYFVCVGISMTQGWVKGSLSEHSKTCFRIGLIYLFGMNWSYFSEYIYGLLYSASGNIGDVLVNASPISLPTLGGSGINGALQSILIEIWDVSQWIMKQSSFPNFSPFVCGFLVGLCGCLLVSTAVLEIIVAKCMLSILFVTAPLFIAFTLFKSTHTFFDRWLGSCMAYASLMIFVCASLGIVISLDQWILGDLYKNKGLGLVWINVGTAILVSLICIGLLKRVVSLAMNIGGSMTTVSGNELIPGTVGGIVGGLVTSKSSGDDAKKHGANKSNYNRSFTQPANHSSNSTIKQVMTKIRQGPQR